ncbi:MAG: hypothetical protein IPO85_17060 [Saprospiraceae bacterium]|uniref:Uncharacterized protein n=1 Tax=Candidatus Defluviibacterium haderslevense TaxID=2981993 RepID=A0A9D7SBZ0_9BACT|nr:hypothetical protein [Candidatus Defluviibacterium haderslevense]
MTIVKNLVKLLIGCLHNLIDKRATGIGATTCELTSPRNSIIVVPTRALAYSKALSHSDSFYLGSPYGNIKSKINDEEIRIYLSSDIEFKKFLVVADSLPRLIKVIGDDVYKDFFIMIDEIDSFQSEVGYRPKMELSIEYFFRFKEGCLVSATLIDFSDPKVNALPRITIDYMVKVKKELNIFYGSRQTVKTVSELIKDYFLKRQYWTACKSDSNSKLLVAYNSVESIMEVIALLPLDLRSKCKVLCSEKSKEKTILDNIEYYDELMDNLLPCQINFITSAYFVGIDIDEAFCPLLVNDSKVQHSFLSLEKIKQIEGRCRVELESVFVLFSRARTDFHGTTKEVLLDRAADQVYSIKSMILSGNTDSLKGESLRYKVEPLIDYFNPQALCKLTSNDNIEVSHLAIDNELLKDKLLNVTYKTPQNFTLAMQYNYEINTVWVYEHLKSEQEMKIIYDYHIEKRQNIEKQKFDFIADLNSNRSNQELFEHTTSKTGNDSYTFYSTLSGSISDTDIATYLEHNFVGSTNTKKLHRITRSYKYFKSSTNSDWKSNIIKEFSIGSEYTPDEILAKIEQIQFDYGTFDDSIGRVTTKTKATQLLGEFLKIERLQKRGSSNQKVNLYKVVGENPMDFKVKNMPYTPWT